MSSEKEKVLEYLKVLKKMKNNKEEISTTSNDSDSCSTSTSSRSTSMSSLYSSGSLDNSCRPHRSNSQRCSSFLFSEERDRIVDWLRVIESMKESLPISNSSEARIPWQNDIRNTKNRANVGRNNEKFDYSSLSNDKTRNEVESFSCNDAIDKILNSEAFEDFDATFLERCLDPEDFERLTAEGIFTTNDPKKDAAIFTSFKQIENQRQKKKLALKSEINERKTTNAVYVRLPHKPPKDHLIKHFQRFGNVTNTNLKYSTDGLEGFIHFEDFETARYCVRYSNLMSIGNRKSVVMLARKSC